MTRRQAQKIVLILLALSLLTLGLNGLIAHFKPELYSAREARRQVPVEKKLDELPQPQTDQGVLANRRGIASWSQDSLLTEFRKVDLSLYQGRNKDDQALRGVCIYLDPGPSVALKTNLNSSTSSQLSTSASPENTGTAQTSTMLQPFAQEPALIRLCALFKTQLEALGAEVVLLRGTGILNTDEAVAAELGSSLLRRFRDELELQGFRSSPLEALLPLLQSTASGQPQTETSATGETAEVVPAAPVSFFSLNGVNSQMRLLLDMERQFRDCLLISFNYSQSADSSLKGCRFSYLGTEVADSLGVPLGQAMNEQNQPAYAAYDQVSRRRLAALFESSVSGLVPDARYLGQDLPTVEEARPLNRLNNLICLQVLPAFASNPEDVATLEQAERQQALAEAMAYACYQYYCTTTLAQP